MLLAWAKSRAREISLPSRYIWRARNDVLGKKSALVVGVQKRLFDF